MPNNIFKGQTSARIILTTNVDFNTSAPDSSKIKFIKPDLIAGSWVSTTLTGSELTGKIYVDFTSSINFDQSGWWRLYSELVYSGESVPGVEVLYHVPEPGYFSIINIWNRVRMFVGDIDLSDEEFTDHQIKDAVEISIPMVDLDYYKGFTITNQGVISPTPDTTMETLIALKAAIILKNNSNQKSDREGIFVKDGDTTIDTTRGSTSKKDSLKSLEDMYNSMIIKLNLQGQNVVKGYRIDMYTGDI